MKANPSNWRGARSVWLIPCSTEQITKNFSGPAKESSSVLAVVLRHESRITNADVKVEGEHRFSLSNRVGVDISSRQCSAFEVNFMVKALKAAMPAAHGSG